MNSPPSRATSVQGNTAPNPAWAAAGKRRVAATGGLDVVARPGTFSTNGVAEVPHSLRFIRSTS